MAAINNPTETALTISTLTELAGLLLGKAQMRPGDLSSAIERFTDAVVKKILNPRKASTLCDRVLASTSAKEARDLVEAAIYEVKQNEAANTMKMNEAAPAQKNAAKAPAKTAAKAPAKAAAKKGDPAGRQSELSGKMLVAKCEKNPRRDNTHGHKSMAIIMKHPSGITTENFLKAGGRLVDLKWDIEHGHVKATEPK